MRLAGGTADEVLRDADTAMYEAKAGRQGPAHDFCKQINAGTCERASFGRETDLQRALPQGQLFVEYQPIVSLTTGQLESVEALVRWRHPQRGIVGPAEFVPIAEETGIICAIGEWVLREACVAVRPVLHLATAARLRPARSKCQRLACRQLLTPGFVEMVRERVGGHAHGAAAPAPGNHGEPHDPSSTRRGRLRYSRCCMRLGVKIDMGWTSARGILRWRACGNFPWMS